MTTKNQVLIMVAAFASTAMAARNCTGAAEGVMLAKCLHDRAMELSDEGRFADAESDYTRAIRMWKELGPRFDAHRATTIAQLSGLQQVQGRLSDAISNLEQSLALHRSSLGDGHERTLGVMVRLAVAYEAVGRTKEAAPLLDTALAPTSALSQVDRAVAWNALGSFYAMRGDYARAIDYLQKSERALSANGDNYPAYGAVLCNLAAAYVVNNETARAAPLLKKVRAIYTANLGPNHPRMASLMLQEGALALAEDRNGEAERILRAANEVAERVFPKDSDELASYHASLGLALLRNGKLDAADRLLPPALAVKRAAYPFPHREVALALHRMAGLRAAQHRDAEARALYSEAVDMYERVLGADNSELRAALNDYAHFARSVRDGGLAKTLERRAKEIHTFR